MKNSYNAKPMSDLEILLRTLKIHSRSTSDGQPKSKILNTKKLNQQEALSRLAPLITKIEELLNDATSGEFYQKDIPQKFGIGSAVYRRIIKEFTYQKTTIDTQSLEKGIYFLTINNDKTLKFIKN